ncbi:MAG TPA: hypothetical protein VEP90_16730 [Methylomirabilota bacterium]|nr:hypothetical protein [Methylomirabilota bacterium]
MNQERSPKDIIRIPPIPSIAETLVEQVRHSNDPDEVTKSLNIPASLLNFHLATPLDLSLAGLGHVVYIPVQVSRREGGRKSVFDLEAGEEALAGIYVTNQGIALEFMKRVTGSTLPAETGDVYQMRLTNREGEEAFQSALKLEVTDASAGNANFLLIEDFLETSNDRTNSSRIFGHCIARSICRRE